MKFVGMVIQTQLADRAGTNQAQSATITALDGRTVDVTPYTVVKSTPS